LEELDILKDEMLISVEEKHKDDNKKLSQACEILRKK